MNFRVNLGEFKAESSLNAIRADLVDNVFCDDLAWFNSVSPHQKEDRELLKKVAGHASEISFDFLDDMEVTDRANDTEEKSGNHGTAEDKNVFVLSDEENKRFIGKNKYPSAILSSIGHDQRLCTFGPPIGTSLSLLGRGTHIWLVRAYVPGDPSLKGDELIVKTAWRKSQRTPESNIHSLNKAPILGLTKCECAGDVIFPGVQTGYPLTVRNLKSDLHDCNLICICDYRDLTLEPPAPHRLILSIVGRPMWSYTTDLELLTGFRDALQTQQRLCNEGILHRNISADNILLLKDSSAPFRGFIIDLDFGHIEDLTVQQPKVTPQMSVIREGKFLSPKPMTRRKIFEGTPQFMSRALLRQAKNGATSFVHRPNDDVESFIWALSYCVMRNLYHQASHHALKGIRDQSAYLRSIFHEAFGQVTTQNLVLHRHSNTDTLEFPIIPAIDKIIAAFMSDALIDLFAGLQDLLADAHKRINPTPLTHDITVPFRLIRPSQVTGQVDVAEIGCLSRVTGGVAGC